MKLKLITALVIIFIIVLPKSNFAQTNISKPNEYILTIKNVKTKTDLKKIETLINSKQNILQFTGTLHKGNFFILRTKMPITNALFSTWLIGSGFELATFKQQAITMQVINQYKSPRNQSEKKINK